MTISTRGTQANGDITEEELRRLEAVDRLVARYFSPEITALIDRDAPEVIGGPGLPKRRLRKE